MNVLHVHDFIQNPPIAPCSRCEPVARITFGASGTVLPVDKSRSDSNLLREQAFRPRVLTQLDDMGLWVRPDRRG